MTEGLEFNGFKRVDMELSPLTIELDREDIPYANTDALLPIITSSAAQC